MKARGVSILRPNLRFFVYELIGLTELKTDLDVAVNFAITVRTNKKPIRY